MRTRSASFDFLHVVLQPTSACNLNCGYCYLPDRARNNLMTPAVSEAVAQSLSLAPHQIFVLWHGGEPLACGLKTFQDLVRPFQSLRRAARVRHSLQTNATLITPEWCDFFKAEEFKIGVSLDGSSSLNSRRVNWSGAPAYEAAMRGINHLKSAGLRFGVIAVLNPANMQAPEEFYDYFVELGCHSISVNVEEREGLNRTATTLDPSVIKEFWRRLFSAWRRRPVLRIREFDHALGWMTAIIDPVAPAVSTAPDLWPTIAHNGDVVVLAPELLSASPPERSQFVLGNVLSEPLHEIVGRAPDTTWVRAYRAGLQECQRTCAYYSYCGGGQASNKYFELGSVFGTETAHCRNTRQALIDAVIHSLNTSVTLQEENEDAQRVQR